MTDYLNADETRNFFHGQTSIPAIKIARTAAQVLGELPLAEQTTIKDYLLGIKIPSTQVRPRSRLFRALGAENPPDAVDVNGQRYHLIEVFKHDSWAATALYNGPHHKIVCKFNRQQSIFGIPMQWLGRRLAQRENQFLQLFAHLTNIPPYVGPVSVNGQLWPHASAHVYIEGTTLRRYQQRVSDDFFPKLQNLLKIIHSHHISYMDLNKQENILVNEQGEPCLIDFQICFHLPKHWPGNSAPLRYLLRLLQQSDEFHLMKHFTRLRPDLFPPDQLALAQKRPWFLNLYRCIQIPLRSARRKLLTLLGFRNRSGQVTSETFIEHGLREKNAIEVAGHQLLLEHNQHSIIVAAIRSNPKIV